MGDYDRGRDRARSGSRGRGERDHSGEARGRDRETVSLLVRNVSYRVRADELRSLFSRYGELRDVYIPQVTQPCQFVIYLFICLFVYLFLL